MAIFSIGERVRVKKTITGAKNHSPGYEFVIYKIEPYSGTLGNIYFPKDKSGMYEIDLESAGEKTIKNIKVGDLVKRNNRSSLVCRVMEVLPNIIYVSQPAAPHKGNLLNRLAGPVSREHFEEKYGIVVEEESETVTIDGKKYLKSEVDSRLRELRPIG